MVFKSYIALVTVLVAIASLQFVSSDSDLESKLRTLTEKNAKDAVIRLNHDEYKRLVRTAPRNYSIIVMLTALDQKRECEICSASYPEYETLAKSWKYSGNSEKKLFFTLIDVDYGNGMEVFRELKLTHAPVVMHFPQKGKPKAKDTFEAQRAGYSADVLAKWVNDRTGNDVKIIIPPDYSKLITQGGLAFLILAVIIYNRNKLSHIIYSHSLWSILAIAFIMVFLGGQMWNSIKSPPFSRNNPKGGKSYVASSNSYQYGAETYIVCGLYSAIMFGFIFLNQAGKYNRTTTKLLIMTIGIVVVAFFFSVLLFIFEAKFQGYPYGISQLVKIKYEL